MAEQLVTRSPVDGRVLLTRSLATHEQLDGILGAAWNAWPAWRRLPLPERLQAVERLVEAVSAKSAALAEELTWQMGRPISQTPGEIGGFVGRGRTMLRLAEEALAPIRLCLLYTSPSPRDRG